jgi:hypothetical protein
MVYPARNPVGDWTDELPEDKKTCGAAFCRYPEDGCYFEEINVGAVDALDFIWIEGAELCLQMRLEDHDQVDEPEPEPERERPPWELLDEMYVVFVGCPEPQCVWSTSYIDKHTGEEEIAEHAYEEHWNEHHA